MTSLAPLKESAYRRVMVSQLFNSLCLWTHRTAIVWLTVVVTDGDPFSVGLVSALQFLPMMLSAFGGGLGDRWSKRTVLFVSQVVAVITSVGLAVLTTLDLATLPVLGAMAVVLGLTAAIDAPTRLAFPREVVAQHLIKSAIGINGVVFQSARVVGPAVAGVVIGTWGEAIGFYVAAGFGVAALVALAIVRPRVTGVSTAQVDGRWMATYDAVRREPALLSPLVGALVVGTCLANLQVAIPLILDRMPGAGAGDFGLLLATIGLGGACGALAASLTLRGQNVRGMNLALCFYCLATLSVAAMPTVPALAMATFVTGLVLQLYNTNALTLLQESSPPGQHGRVMGLYVVTFFVWASFGTPLFGLAAGAAGPREMLAVSSLLCAVGGAVLWARSPTSRSYRRLSAEHCEGEAH